MKRLSFFIVLISLSLTACKGDSTPEGALRSFIETRFDGGFSAKRDLLAITTGGLWAELDAMTQEDWEYYLDMSEYDLRRLRVEREVCKDDECFITYLLRYDQLRLDNLGEKAFEAEVRKIAKVENIDGVWKVSDVSDVKTFYRANEPIEPLLED